MRREVSTPPALRAWNRDFLFWIFLNGVFNTALDFRSPAPKTNPKLFHLGGKFDSEGSLSAVRLPTAGTDAVTTDVAAENSSPSAMSRLQTALRKPVNLLTTSSSSLSAACSHVADEHCRRDGGEHLQCRVDDVNHEQSHRCRS